MGYSISHVIPVPTASPPPSSWSREGTPVETNSWLLYREGFAPEICSTLPLALFWKLVVIVLLEMCCGFWEVKISSHSNQISNMFVKLWYDNLSTFHHMFADFTVEHYFGSPARQMDTWINYWWNKWKTYCVYLLKSV